MNRKITLFLLFFLTVSTLVVAAFALANRDQVQATVYPSKWCHKFERHQCVEQMRFSCNGDWDEGRCATPTPTHTPAPTMTPTPTIDPCHIEQVTKDDEWQEHDPCVTPTPEPTVEPTSTPKQEERVGDPAPGEGKHNEIVCNGVAVDAPLLQGFKKTSDTSVFWSWWASLTQGINRQWIEYGYEKDKLSYSVDVPTNVTGYEIGQLDPKAPQNWARVCVDKGGCNKCSEPLDP